MNNTLSKFNCRAALFKAEPPANRKHVKELFCGRTMELARGCETLRRNLDIKGRQSRQFEKFPWIIHGESRCGKSHLARRILASFPDSPTNSQFTVSAKGKLSAFQVMAQLFARVRSYFSLRVLDVHFAPSPLQRSDMDLLIQLVNRVDSFLAGAEAAVVKTSSSSGASLEVGLPVLKEFLMKFSMEASEEKGMEITLSKPKPSDLAAICRIMFEALLNFGLMNHAFVLADDVDLLEGAKMDGEDVREQRSALSECLVEVSESRGVDVVVTARTWYAQTQKDFMILVDLSVSEPMSATELKQIHDQHWRVFGAKTWPGMFLTEQALVQIAEDCGGLPGIFLQHLSTAFQAFQSDEDWGTREYDWFLAVFKKRYGNLREKCPAAAKELEKAIEHNQFAFQVGPNNPIVRTALEDTFVFQSYYSERTWFTTQLVQKIIPTIPAA